MKVGILGAGGIGFGTAVLLAAAGHEPVIWSPSGKGTQALAERTPLAVTGAMEGTFKLAVASRCEDAVTGAGAVIIALPAYAHRTAIDAALPHLRDGQVVIVSSHYSLSALYLSRRINERGLKVAIVAWGTTMLMSRLTAPAQLTVLVVRTEVDLATIPASQNAHGLAACRELFGDRFRARDNLLAIQFSNINPPAHLANVICNLTRIEKAEPWGNYDCITPTVGRLIEQLDVERLDLARAFGVEVRSVHEHMRRSFDLTSSTMAGMAREVQERFGGLPGPISLDARWFHEDFPYGIAPLLDLGRMAGVSLRLHQAGFDLLCTLLDRDLRGENDLLPELQLDRLSVKELQMRTAEGWVS